MVTSSPSSVFTTYYVPHTTLVILWRQMHLSNARYCLSSSKYFDLNAGFAEGFQFQPLQTYTSLSPAFRNYVGDSLPLV